MRGFMRWLDLPIVNYNIMKICLRLGINVIWYVCWKILYVNVSSLRSM
jgi:hypothetical protein